GGQYPDRGGRFWLYGRAHCDARARPDHQRLRGTSGGHRGSRACEECDGRSVLYRATILIRWVLMKLTRLIWSREQARDGRRPTLVRELMVPDPMLGRHGNACRWTAWT